MTLIWCFCLGLALTGLVFRQRIRTTFEGVYFSLYGAPLRVATRPKGPSPDRPVARPSRQEPWPAFQVQTRAGP